jgi:phosphate transport system protein
LRHLQEELDELNSRLLEMGGLVEEAIFRSVRVVIERDAPSAQIVFQNESRINLLETKIDNVAIGLLALQQPMAADLRFVTMAIKINNNLERMGDIAVNIAERGVSLLSESTQKPRIDVPHMAKLAQEMIRKSLDAFVRKDAELARDVLKSDDAVDLLRDEIYADIVKFMEADPRRIHPGIDYIFIARGLERLGDHATNIAEDVLFFVQGIDVRHRAERQNFADSGSAKGIETNL